MTVENQEAFEEEIRLDSFFKWLWRGKWLIIGLTVIASAIAAFSALRQPELHTSTALIEIGRVWGKPLKDIYVTVEMANSPGFVQDVAAKVGIRPGQLNRAVQVSALESGVPHSIYPILIRVTAKTENADDSVRLAQAVADEIVDRHEKLFADNIATHLERQQQLEQRLKELGSTPSDREYAFKLEAELDEVKAGNSSPTSTEKTHLVDRVVPGGTTKPDILRSTATAGLLGGIIGVAAACVVGYYRSSRGLRDGSR